MALTKVKGSVWDPTDQGLMQSVEEFGAVGDGVTDDSTALQAALDAQVPVYMPPGVYIVETTLTFSDNSQLIGAGMFSGVRNNSGEEYDSSMHTVIKSSGISGSNSCVLRLSETAVGTAASDLTPPGTHDLYGVRLEGITVDCNGEAEIGVYCYRCVDCDLGPFSVESSVEHGIYIVGCFTDTFNSIVAYSNEKNGITVGADDYGWSSTEIAVNACTFVRPTARYNGTGEDYNQSTNETEGHGMFLQLNRGNVFIDLVSEVNDGAGIYLYNNSSNFGGPNKFIGGYLESNQDDVVDDARGTSEYNLMVSYPDDMRNLEIDGMYIGASHDIFIDRTGTNILYRDQFLKFKNCYFGGTITVDSDTPNFIMENCSPVPTFSDQLPDLYSVSFDTGGAAIKNASSLPVYSTIHLTSTSASSTGALTLTDGEEGDKMRIVMISDAGTAGVITHNGSTINLGNASTITFDDVGDSADLLFTNDAWHFMGGTATVA